MKQGITSMKLLVLMCLGFTFFINATSDYEERIAQAHQYYTAGEYKKAYELYHEIENKGAALWYNVGNCAFRLGNYGDAFVCWQRAHKQAPRALQKWCTHNSRYAQEKLGMPISQASFITKVLKLVTHIIQYIPLLVWQIVVLVIWYCLWFYGHRWYYNKRFMMITLMVALLCSSLGALAISYTHNKTISVYSGNSPVQVYAVPGTAFNVIGTVPPHTIVAIDCQYHEWYKIHTPQVTGWILQEHVITI